MIYFLPESSDYYVLKKANATNTAIIELIAVE